MNAQEFVRDIIGPEIRRRMVEQTEPTTGVPVWRVNHERRRAGLPPLTSNDPSLPTYVPSWAEPEDRK